MYVASRKPRWKQTCLKLLLKLGAPERAAYGSVAPNLTFAPFGLCLFFASTPSCSHTHAAAGSVVLGHAITIIDGGVHTTSRVLAQSSRGS